MVAYSHFLHLCNSWLLPGQWAYMSLSSYSPSYSDTSLEVKASRSFHAFTLCVLYHSKAITLERKICFCFPPGLSVHYLYEQTVPKAQSGLGTQS